MKRIILFSILFSFLLIINSYATAPALQVSTNVTPSSIAPGEDGFVQITITNVGTVTADKVVVTLDSIDNPLVSKTIFSAEGIGGLEAAKSTYTVFRFSVPPETPEGYYNIQFKIKSCENSA
ncbi:MAG: CARDB domain-containing protein, partial [Methanosarcinales archaeon]